MTHVDSIRTILVRDFGTLLSEITAYNYDSQIWELPTGIKNSAGTLTLHLVGNTRFFIGMVLGKSGFVRDRDAEFTTRDVLKSELIMKIETARTEIDAALTRLKDSDLHEPYPQLVGELQLTTGLFLTHLIAHFGYHLGQLDYHRRIVTGNSNGLGAQSIAEIAEGR